MFESFNKFFTDASPEIDQREILRYCLALSNQYQIAKNHMPLPIFRREGLKDSPQQAWTLISEYHTGDLSNHPISIYIHVPFCPQRCSFCDCLTTPLKENQHYLLDDYLNRLLSEIQYWKDCGSLSQRPVSTVHFGGGTPLFLGLERFQTLCASIKQSFHIQETTEWALETTTSSLTENSIEVLHQIGFHRLHLGIQSMEDSVREKLRRRETTNELLDKLNTLTPKDWVVSVDLLVGLPGETLQGIIEGINHLIEAKVDGFSVYEIHFSSQNKVFAQQYQLPKNNRIDNYFLFLAATQHLINSGYQKNLFNHFANQRDENIYFTFPTRNEDCLAIGAYADGSFGSYHYRNLPYPDYLTDKGRFIDGGIMETPVEILLKPTEIALLSGGFSIDQFPTEINKENLMKLIQTWKANFLIEQTEDQQFSLTPNGAWFSGNMIQDLHQLVRELG